MAEAFEEPDHLDHGNEEDAGEGQQELQFRAALDDIKRRCKEAGLVYKPPSPELAHAALVHIRDGRGTRCFYISDFTDARTLLDCSFENYTYLNDLEAICSYSEGFIAAAIMSLTPSALYVLRKSIFGLKSLKEGEDTSASVELEPPPAQPGISASLRLSAHPMISQLHTPVASLEIRGLRISTHDEAVRMLETFAGGLLFELDTRFNVALALRRNRPASTRPSPRSDELARKPLHFPLWKYDKEPAELYWYARSANRMPLMQFLAFYQVLEYYFPIASQREAIHKTRSMLKDPAFSVNDDTDMTRLLAAIQTTKSGGYGDERTQLRATVHSCVSTDDLRSFITSSEKFVKFYSEGKEWKDISTRKIAFKNPDVDIRSEVADRIYDIRCKIVHARSDGGPNKTDLLLPWSREADHLGFDIEVIRYVARQALTSASTAIQW